MYHSPVVVKLEVTHRCNYHCMHCFSSCGSKWSDELSTNEIRALIDELDEMDVFELQLLGGEPFLRSDIMEIGKYAYKKNLAFAVVTNGSLITEEIAREIKKVGFSLVGVSLDGCTSEIHDSFRGMPGAFDKALAAIKVLKRNHVPEVHAYTVISKFNCNHLERIMRFLDGLEVDRIFVLALKPFGRGWVNRHLCLDPDQIHSLQQDIRIISRSLKAKVLSLLDVKCQTGGYYVPTSAAPGLCPAGIDTCYIYAEGTVKPCSIMDLPAGNIRHSSFKDIWYNSPVFAKIRELRPDDLIGKCKTCKNRYKCRGGCRSVQNAYHGSILSSYEDCVEFVPDYTVA